MKLKRLFVVLAMMCLFVMVGCAQQSKGKRYVLKGMVTNLTKDSVTVDHGRIEGYSKAAIKPYKIDKPEILAKVKKGDHIQATVYDNDDTLYDVEVAPYYDDIL
jgi:hypothetical protein